MDDLIRLFRGIASLAAQYWKALYVLTVLWLTWMHFTTGGVTIDMALGILVLLAGGEAVVRGSVAAARSLGLSEFFIGVVLIGFGTSSPELITSVQAAWHGSPGIAFGNVVGSNISNVLLILGVTAWLFPIVVEEKIATKNSVLLLLLMALFTLVCLIFPLTRGVALFFVAVTGAYVYWLHKNDSSPVETHGMEVVVDTNKWHFVQNIALAVVGVIGLIIGSDLLVASAVEVARFVGMSEAAIGLTLIAVGTSLPELVSSIMAARAGKPGLALGNVIGSNVLNVFGILGIVGLVAPSAVPGDIRFVYNPLMLAVTAVLVYLMYSRRVLSKVTGKYFVGAFVAYTVFLMLFG